MQALLGDQPRLYDVPPFGAALPFAVLGETRMRDWPGVEGGLDHEIRIEIASRYRGRREVKQILNAVYDALHEVDLTLDGQRLVQLRFLFADVFPRSDRRLFRGVARFRALTEPLAQTP